MDQHGLNSNMTLLHSQDAQANPRILASSDPEAFRGRKRRRDPLTFTLQRPQPSRESSTLRGRGRYRSPSRVALLTISNNTHLVSTLSSRAVSGASRASSRGRDASPEKRHVMHHHQHHPHHHATLSVTLEGGGHRRSPSPSRSRSPGATALLAVVGAREQRRRRQRTSSRSRRHGLEGPFATRREMGRHGTGFGGWIEESSIARDRD